MPRSPEWVQPKAYERFRWKMKWPEREANDERITKAPKQKQSRQEEQKAKEKARQQELKEEQDPGKGKKGKEPPRQRQPKDDQPTGGKEPSRGKEVDRVSDSRGVDARPKPGADVEWREPDWDPGRIWAHAERIYPPGIEGRRALPPAPPRALAGPYENPALAQMVHEAMSTRPALGPGKERSANGMTIYTGEIVEDMHQRALGSGGRAIGPGEPPPSIHDTIKDTREIRAIRPGSWDATTAPIPKIQTDDTIPMRPARRGDTTSFEPISGKVISPEAPKTGPDFVSTRQFPTIKGELQPDATPLSDRPIHRRGITQHAEPFGQMALFEVPEESRGTSTLSQARSERTERFESHPTPAPPLGRQVIFHTSRMPKAPGSQGTLFQQVEFKPKKKKSEGGM